MNMLALAYVAFGGAFGAMGRHLVINFVGNHTSLTFPYGTLTVNVLGSLILGLWVGAMAYIMPAKAKDLHLLFAVGALGSFTTFSAFSLEVILLIDRSGILLAAAYVLASVLVSVAAVFLGMMIARYALA